MADPLGSLEKIVKLALRIKEAVDTVRHNKEECQLIRTHAVRVSSLLSRLPETGITGDPVMCDALGDLEDALHNAHALVTACQQSSTMCLYCAAGKQARRLRQVKDDISQKVMLVVFATNIHTTIILTNIIRVSGDAPPSAQVTGAMTAPHVVVPCNIPAGVASSEEAVEAINLPMTSFTSSVPGLQGLSTVIRNEVARQGIKLAAQLVSHSLFSDAEDSHLISNSGHQAVSPLTDSMSSPTSCTKMQEADDGTDIRRDTTLPSYAVMDQPKVPSSASASATVSYYMGRSLPLPQPDSMPHGQDTREYPRNSMPENDDQEVALPPPPPRLAPVWEGRCRSLQPTRLATMEIDQHLKLGAPTNSTAQPVTRCGSAISMASTIGRPASLDLPIGLPVTGLRKFSFSELEAATRQFSVENMDGSGAFATVYKGVLHDGLPVAVKKFRHPYDLSAGNIDKLQLVSNLNHKNIVKLIGYSGDVLQRARQFEDAKLGAKEVNKVSYLLVEEYMPNGSLDKAINGLQLDWSSKFHLIQGVARGLCYLQEQGVVHMDVKSSNILLDSDMNPKISDFGIARVLNHSGADICSDIGTIAGTLGYMPPEYITNGTLSKKHDVYGFGVTLLEIISSMSRSGRASGQASIKWAWEARQAGGMMDQLDPSRFDAPQLKEIERCIEVGLLCTQFEPADRPDMLEALEMLRGEKALRTPVRPGYINKDPAGSWLRKWLRS